MEYSKHKIKSDGHIEVREVDEDGTFHRFLIKPSQPIEKYNEQIESDPDFEKYRTQENTDAYEQKLAESMPSEEELKEQRKQRAEQKARQKALDALVEKEMVDSGLRAELEEEKRKIDNGEK